MAGKGSKPRPIVVPKEQYDSNHETIFGKYIPPYLRNRTEEKSVEKKTDDK